MIVFVLFVLVVFFLGFMLCGVVLIGGLDGMIDFEILGLLW